MGSLAASSVVLLSIAALSSAMAPANPARMAPAAELTMDRLSSDQMEELVAKPMALVRSGKLGQAKSSFEKMMSKARKQRGENSVIEADLLTAFGVSLYVEGLDRKEDALRRASLPYLAQAIPAYRAAFGPIHPEVAVALNSHADVIIALNDDVATPEAEAAIEEALSIRLATLGPGNIETLASRKQLAIIRGHPARVAGDGARLAVATDALRAAIGDAPETPDSRHESAPMMRLALALMLARNGSIDEAVIEGNRALEAMEAWQEDERCVRTFSVFRLIETLDKSGDAAARLITTREQALDLILACAEL